MRPGRRRYKPLNYNWSRRSDLNRGPAVYETNNLSRNMVLSIPQLTRSVLHSSTPSRTASRGMRHGFNSLTALCPLGVLAAEHRSHDYCCRGREGPNGGRPVGS